jgi:hypothetical protein
MEKIYHIYAKDNCIFHSLKEEEFSIIWNTLTNMIELIQSEYSKEDLSYEELLLNKKNVLESSH